MMKQQKTTGLIILRKIQRHDYVLLEKDICKTWHLTESFGDKTAMLLSKAYLSYNLIYQTFNRVVVVNKQTVGIIAGNNKQKQKAHLKYVIRLFLAILQLLLTKEGRSGLKSFFEMNKIYKKLMKNSGRNYGGKLSSFVINPAYCGLGLGKKLFQSFIQYLEEEKVETFYLYTDTYCNYQFYDKQGMQKRIEEKCVFFFGNDELREKFLITYFLYDYNFQWK